MDFGFIQLQGRPLIAFSLIRRTSKLLGEDAQFRVNFIPIHVSRLKTAGAVLRHGEGAPAVQDPAVVERKDVSCEDTAGKK